MTPDGAVTELAARVAANWPSPTFITAKELALWPDMVASTLRQQKLVTRAKPARSAVCPGCERACAMPVESMPRPGGAAVHFVVCDKRSDVGRVPVSADALSRLQSSVAAFASFIGDALALGTRPKPTPDQRLVEIGMLSGKKRAQMLCLGCDPELVVVCGANAVPVRDVIRFDGSLLLVDVERLKRLVDSSTTGDSRHTPSTARREARKLASADMYEQWQKEYRTLKRARPGMSDVWYSRQIAKMDCAQGKKPETIRRRMKG